MKKHLARFLLRLVNSVLSRASLELRRKGLRQRFTAEDVVAQLCKLGIRPNTVLDVGAAYGEWSEMCHRILPDATYLMIEPLEEFRPFLADKDERFNNFRYIAAAASSSSGRLEIKIHPDLSGSSMFEENEEDLSTVESRSIQATTLDLEVSRAVPLPSPYLVKIDVQGAELEVLHGAPNVLRDCEAVFVETSLFRFFTGGPQLDDLVLFMKGLGFVVYDICDLLYRPLDGALAQMDLVFVPEKSKLRDRHVYAEPEQRRHQNQAMQRSFERRRRALQVRSKRRLLRDFSDRRDSL